MDEGTMLAAQCMPHSRKCSSHTPPLRVIMTRSGSPRCRMGSGVSLVAPRGTTMARSRRTLIGRQLRLTAWKLLWETPAHIKNARPISIADLLPKTDTPADTFFLTSKTLHFSLVGYHACHWLAEGKTSSSASTLRRLTRRPVMLHTCQQVLRRRLLTFRWYGMPQSVLSWTWTTLNDCS